MPIQLIIRNPLDRDAREYIGRAGVSDAAARLQLNEFVRGVKALGLWNSMVCWPLRSTQNAGTGTTAYSLGGLGTFNGTLVNGPTWGADGVASDQTNKNIQHTAGRDLGTAPFSFGFCAKQEVGFQSTTIMGLYDNAATPFGAYDISINASGVPDTAVRSTFNAPATLSRVIAGQISVNTFFLHTTTRNDSLVTSNLNANQVGTNSGLATGVDVSRTDVFGRLLSRDGGISTSRNAITKSFAFIVKGQAISPAGLYNLYKATLGTGLGLP
jgi:hypothetical protein